MKTYDLYVFGPRVDVIVGWHKFECENSEAAIALAVGMKLPGAQELWQGQCLVKRWPDPI